MSAPADVGVVGLGTMGANLARNFARRGLRVAGYDRSAVQARDVVSAHPEAGIRLAESIGEFVSSLARPRRIILLVPAGPPVDVVLDELDGLLKQDDIVIDAGNSHHADTQERLKRVDSKPWRLIGMGVSGGAEGALTGPSMMPGGDLDSWRVLRPLLEPVAADGPFGPCVTWCGTGSAGHFVKMVHNGIEYGAMQLIAETATLLRRGLGLEPEEIANTFSRWNEGALESYLVEITADIFRVRDPRLPNALLLDSVLDAAQQKGTGRWTVVAASNLGVAIPTISSAVEARQLSALKALRREAERTFDPKPTALSGVSIAALADALYASKVASYAQGFAMLRAASDDYGWGIPLDEVARIWTAGCIIRARFLGRVKEAFESDPALSFLALAPSFVEELKARLPGWRQVVSKAVVAGLPVPGLAASLSWFDGLVAANGNANIIQAQRDYFGSHGYERVGGDGMLVHSDWRALAGR